MLHGIYNRRMSITTAINNNQKRMRPMLNNGGTAYPKAIIRMTADNR
jgi:hypothetical protein